MKKNIHFFAQGTDISDEAVLEKLGIRGRRAIGLASLDLPILPGFIIDADIASRLDDQPVLKHIEPFFEKIGEITGKQFGDPNNPMLVKIVISSNLEIVSYPTLHNFGLSYKTIKGFNTFVGQHFGYHEVKFLLKGNLEIEAKIAELEGRKADQDKLRKLIGKLKKELYQNSRKDKVEAGDLDQYLEALPEGFFDDPFAQIEIAVKRISKLLDMDEFTDNDTAILIQPMVYGNYDTSSSSGNFFTRNVVSGEAALQGEFYQNEFDSIGAEGQDIQKIDKTYLKRLETIARTVEKHFKEIRSIRFTVEKKVLWLIEQRAVMEKSTQAELRLLLDLKKNKVIDEVHLINNIKTHQLGDILHPVVNYSSAKKLPSIEGGISGAPGAAIGRVYFSTDKLLDSYKMAQQCGEDTRCILCMPATFAEDVKAIEVATGVLSNEGGYAAHASVVARQYGKVSLVKNDLKIRGNKATIGSVTIKEGDYITLSVPNYGDPIIYLAEAPLIEPDPEASGLLEFLSIIRNHVGDFHVRANADSPRDAQLAKLFGARGIGLCRTEHMFFNEKRINVFREMIISDNPEKRLKALNKLKPMQKADFYKLFKIMEGEAVTIRLLDAPLHEFLPHTPDEMNNFIQYLNGGSKSKSKSKVPEKEIRMRCDTLSEFNPMLGHRGCRLAITYPEIYEMQMSAIFEALYALQSEGIHVEPEIMVPLIMNESELKMIIYGKKIEGQSIKGLLDVEKEVREKLEVKKAIEYKIGTMIELPCAALSAGEISRYAQFFSFGTNDLTQTTMGLSRDDFNNFMPDYTQFDILGGNPFMYLNRNVKELVQLAVERGRMTRPDIKLGLCGEQGAIPENIRFCMQAGLNYVSCSAFSIPIATLAIAQLNTEGLEEE